MVDESINSMIASFEKKPDMKGIPIKAILDIPRMVIVIGEWIVDDPIWRMS